MPSGAGANLVASDGVIPAAIFSGLSPTGQTDPKNRAPLVNRARATDEFVRKSLHCPAVLSRFRLSPLRSQLRVTDEVERRRIERVLAVARAYLAVLAFLAFYMRPTEPAEYRDLVSTLLAFYVLSAMVILYSVGSAPRLTAQFTNFIHFTDILWPAVDHVVHLRARTVRSSRLLTVFALLAAGHRWGLHEALATALLCVQVILLQSYPWGLAGWGQVDLATLITPATFVFVTAFLVGFLADAEKQLRGEANALARMMRYAQTERGLRTSLQLILGELLRLFGPERVELAARDSLSGAVSVWRIDRKRPDHVQLVQEESAAGRNTPRRRAADRACTCA